MPASIKVLPSVESSFISCQMPQMNQQINAGDDAAAADLKNSSRGEYCREMTSMRFSISSLYSVGSYGKFA